VGQGRFWTIPSVRIHSSDTASSTTVQVAIFLWHHCLFSTTQYVCWRQGQSCHET